MVAIEIAPVGAGAGVPELVPEPGLGLEPG